ncbi:MAG: glycosyltransferase [Anaerolineae bacterium]|nr:glycosyltransferase [Anaerolineae bacterium]
MIVEGVGGGGTFAMNQAVHELLKRGGAQPTVAYPGTLDGAAPQGRVRRLFARLTALPTVQRGVQAGMTVMAFPVFPGRSADLRNRWFARRLRPHLRAYDEFVFSNPTVPRVLRHLADRVPALCWVCTTVRDELESQLAGGDLAAARQLRDASWPAREAQERQSFLAASLVLAASDHTAACVRAFAPGANVRTLPLPVDTAVYAPRGGAQHDGPPALLFVAARLNDPRKNAPLLFQAFAQVRREADASLWVVGGEPAPDLVDLCAALGIADRVRFLGRLPRHTDLAPWYRRATLLVVASRQEGYGFPVSEAMACGLPVVSTRCGGPETALAESGAGVLTGQDADSLAAAILDLLADPRRRAAMAQAGVAYARAHLSFEAVGPRFDAARAAVFGRPA